MQDDYSTEIPDDTPKPTGRCECGCGGCTTLYKGEYRRFISGHNGRKPFPVILDHESVGWCECGCGQRTEISLFTSAELGYVRGEYRKYINGHKPRKKVEITPTETRFWNLVDKSDGPDACWPWRGYRNKKGYGQFSTGRDISEKPIYMSAHRMSYIFSIGPIPDGLVIMHFVCDNPPCCNPAHLKAGTHKENVWDSINKGHREAAPSPFGEKHPNAVMSTRQVEECRKLYATGEWTCKGLGERYGVDKSTIHYIVKGKNRSQG